MNCLPGCATDDQCNVNETCDVALHDCVCDDGFKLCGAVCVPEQTPCDGECGNGIIDGGELCDGDQLGGQGCLSQGFDDGELACGGDCQSFDTSDCISFDCNSDYFIEIPATDAELLNWDIVASQLEPNDVVAYMSGEVNHAEWSIDVPCDDTWHVWIRAIDYLHQDWYRVRIDGFPNSAHYFHSDLQCSNNPMTPEYKWTELNLSDPDGGFCAYQENPWVLDWETGTHTVWLMGSEGSGYAVSKLWVTNTNQTP